MKPSKRIREKYKEVVEYWGIYRQNTEYLQINNQFFLDYLSDNLLTPGEDGIREQILAIRRGLTE